MLTVPAPGSRDTLSQDTCQMPQGPAGSLVVPGSEAPPILSAVGGEGGSRWWETGLPGRTEGGHPWERLLVGRAPASACPAYAVSSAFVSSSPLEARTSSAWGSYAEGSPHPHAVLLSLLGRLRQHRAHPPALKTRPRSLQVKSPVSQS